jgi:hypothetical protein
MERRLTEMKEYVKHDLNFYKLELLSDYINCTTPLTVRFQDHEFRIKWVNWNKRSDCKKKKFIRTFSKKLYGNEISRW